MANNKIQLSDGTVLLDITDTTATAADVTQGKYFYNAAGVKTTGTAADYSWVEELGLSVIGGTVNVTYEEA